MEQRTLIMSLSNNNEIDLIIELSFYSEYYSALQLLCTETEQLTASQKCMWFHHVCNVVRFQIYMQKPTV